MSRLISLLTSTRIPLLDSFALNFPLTALFDAVVVVCDNDVVRVTPALEVCTPPLLGRAIDRACW